MKQKCSVLKTIFATSISAIVFSSLVTAKTSDDELKNIITNGHPLITDVIENNDVNENDIIIRGYNLCDLDNGSQFVSLGDPNSATLLDIYACNSQSYNGLLDELFTNVTGIQNGTHLMLINNGKHQDSFAYSYVAIEEEIPGPQGPIGATGLQGIKGDTGIAGSKGETGLQGNTGAQGLTGPQGLQGDTGPIGPRGLKGDTGPIGSRGLKGDTGALGERGLQGNTGAQGLIGSRGLKGDTGPIGSRGLKGDTGALGERGLQGNTGAQGLIGPRGLKGDTGSIGSRGLKGDTGALGERGLQGNTGAQGFAGPSGLKGDTGAIGSRGLKGDTGAQGEQGVSGEIVCPIGFTDISSQGIRLGCMQNNEHGSADWFGAMNRCFVTWGARLPSREEWYLAMAMYDLDDETNNWEWTNNEYFNGGSETTGGTPSQGLTGLGSITARDRTFASNPVRYRCFIPR